jgi:hypothetical protein
MLVDVLPWAGWFTVLLSITAMGALLTFAVLNIRVGGMVLVVAGIGLNLLVTILNWGTPVSAWALETAGVVDDAGVYLPGCIRIDAGHNAGDGDGFGGVAARDQTGTRGDR